MSRSGPVIGRNPKKREIVLIPLLVDVPLWDALDYVKYSDSWCLNPSFSGCPALGVLKLVALCSYNRS